MLIAFLIAVSLLSLAVGAGLYLLGRVGRDVLRAEIQSLREKLAGTSGRLKESQANAETMTEIARSALDVAKQKYPAPFETESIRGTPVDLESKFNFDSITADYVAPTTANCSACKVSVRSDTWPVTCPNTNCGATIWDEDEILSASEIREADD